MTRKLEQVAEAYIYVPSNIYQEKRRAKERGEYKCGRCPKIS
jgi:hypothetical protein